MRNTQTLKFLSGSSPFLKKLKSKSPENIAHKNQNQDRQFRNNANLYSQSLKNKRSPKVQKRIDSWEVQCSVDPNQIRFDKTEIDRLNQQFCQIKYFKFARGQDWETKNLSQEWKLVWDVEINFWSTWMLWRSKSEHWKLGNKRIVWHNYPFFPTQEINPWPIEVALFV